MRSLADQIRAIVRQELARAGLYSRRGAVKGFESLQAGNGIRAQLQGHIDDQLDVDLAEPFGLACRPPSGTDLVAVRTRSQLVAVAAHATSYRPSPDDGEVVLYSAHGQRLTLGADGWITAGSSTSAVARVGDACTFDLEDGNGDPVTGTIAIGPSGSVVLRA